LYIKCKILKDGDKDLETADDVSVCNIFLHALFSQCEVFLNNQIVSTSNNCYAYRAYIESILKYTYGHKSDLYSTVFAMDTNNFSITSTNSGYSSRKDHFKLSAETEMCGKLFFDLAYQKRFILNDTPLSIVLTRSDDKFCLLTPTLALKPKVKMLDASFFIRRHVVYPSIILSHHKLLESGNNIKYPMVATDLRFFTIPKGNQSFLEDDVFQGSVPARVIISMVSNAAFIGDYTKNPFKFEHFDVCSINVAVNNMSIPMRPLNFDLTNNTVLVGYYLLHKCISKLNENQGLIFGPSSYGQGYALFGFDINPLDLTDSTMYLEKTGSVKLELKYSKPLAEAVTLIVYAEHQKVLEIDKHRQVTVQ